MAQLSKQAAERIPVWSAEYKAEYEAKIAGGARPNRREAPFTMVYSHWVVGSTHSPQKSLPDFNGHGIAK